MQLKLEKILRPIRRNTSPIPTDYNDYKDAKTELISRIGSGIINGRKIKSYCSYCERAIDTNLAVEHIEPKDGDYGQPHLIGRWNNFLLACVNCNSTKSAKEVIFNDIYLPDRDNTFFAFDYQADGNINPSNNADIRAMATLSLVGLNKELRETYDADGFLIAQDRASQRLNIWGIAQSSLDAYLTDQNNQAVKDLIIKNMVLGGFFSIWMTVFNNYPEMKLLFIAAMNGTSESDCFNLTTATSISPHPNTDLLQGGGKI